MLGKHHLPIVLLINAIFVLTLTGVCSLQAAQRETVFYEGTVDASSLTWIRDSDGSYTPHLPEMATLFETDKPILFQQSLNLLVPMDTPVGSIEIVPLQTHLEGVPGKLNRGGLLYPDQGEGIVVDRLAVGENAFPQVWGEYGGSHIYRGFRLISVLLYPIRAIRNDAGEWTAVEILDRYTIRIISGKELEPTAIAQRQRKVPGERQRTESLLRKVITNPEALAGYDRQDGTTVPEPTGGFQPARTPTLSGSAVAYLIITNEALADEFQVLADHYTAMGIPTVVATSEWIAGNFRHGADIQETIRSFIREAYEKWGVEWVLLGGDTDVLPARFVSNTYYPPGSYTDIPVDIYFACLDGNWNADGDYVYGEPYINETYPGDEVDLADEVYIGRAPVSSENDATVFVDKVITYSSTVAESGWPDRSLFAAEVLFPQNWSHGTSVVLDGAELSEALIDSFLVPCTTMEYTRMYENYWDYPGSVPLTREALIDTLNTGHYGTFNQIGHGFYFNMSVGDANFTTSDADALTNGDHLFMIYALNCASAAFDKSCLLERFLQNPNGGSIVSIGSSRAAFPFTTHQFQSKFFDHLWCRNAHRVGEIISLSRLPFIGNAYTNTVFRWTIMVYTLLGDPALSIWSGVPASAQVTAPVTLNTGAQSLAVTVNSGGSPVDSALVCLSKTGDDYVHGFTNLTGQVILPFTPTSGGQAVLTVTGTNLEFTQQSIPVNVGSTYIAVSDLQVVDDGTDGSVGNGNGFAEAGETVAMYLECQDTGGGGATSCNATVTTSTSGIAIIDGSANVGNVPPGGTVIALEPLLFSVDTSFTDGHRAEFDVVINDGGNSYESEPTLTVLAPEIEPVELVWSDLAYGDADSTIEDGERIDVEVTLKNFGAGLADEVTAILRSADPEITFYDSVVVYTDIELLERTNGNAAFSLSDANASTVGWCWVLFTDNYGRTLRHDFQLDPPVVPTGMETDTSFGPDIIALRWLPINDVNLRGYNVYRSEVETGPFTRTNLDIIEKTSYFRDDGLSLLTRYYYTVTAVDSSLVEGPHSEVFSQSTAPPEVSGFPLPFARETSGHCAVGDVTGDGRLEIVLGVDEIYVWTDDGGELFNGDNNSQTHGPITDLNAQFQPSGITLAPLDDQPGLEIIASERDSCRIYVFRKDGTILDGWPQDLNYNLNTGWNWATPAVGDVDGDGGLDIVVNTQDGTTWAWHANGTELRDGDNNPLTNGVFVDRNENYGKCSPALFDIDGDGAKEIIFGTKLGVGAINYLLAYRYDGNQAVGFPYAVDGGNIQSSPTVADLNVDGVWEIIFHAQDDSLYVVQQDGTDYPGFPIWLTANTNYTPSPAVGDFDQDGELEIVAVATYNGASADLYLFDTDIGGGTTGQPLSGWPQALPGNTEASPIVGDIDGDGVVDVLHGIGGGDEESPDNLYAFTAGGDYVAGFPITLGGPLRPSPVICDLDRDGDVDIVYGGWDMQIHVWDMPSGYDLSQVPFPWRTFRGHFLRDGVFRPATVVDVPEPVNDVQLRVEPPYPNPFNPTTTLKLYLPGGVGTMVPLQVGIYDVRGRRIQTLHDGPALTGWHTWVWDGRSGYGRNQASGVYFLRARSGAQSVVQKMSLIK